MKEAPKTTDTLNTTAIEWRDGQPYSTHFQDVYFSSDDGFAETEYVFVQGNGLASRFQHLNTSQFTIIETGFGTGLNFLCTVKLWLETAPAHARLQFVSTEKYPLSLADMTASNQLWSDLTEFSEPFLTQYQNLIGGTGTISLFDNRVQLTLLPDDANTTLSTITTKADAWFLDGFAPAKNPEMWQPALFQKMAKLSKTDTTFATFTSAGNVRRGLQAAGFSVSKRPGFGKKREMLTGHYIGK